MADCSYARCIQERRFIKRELQRWTKNMVYIVGLERVAEELMGRRKWKQFQDLITRSNINIDATNLTQKSATSPVVNNGHHHTQNSQESQEIANLSLQKIADLEDKHLQLDNSSENQEKQPESDQSSEIIKIKEEIKAATESEFDQKAEIKKESVELEDNNQPKPVDWKPQDKCYFCVDGKILKVNEAGELVAEAGPVQTEAELTNRTLNDSDSESSESERDIRSKLAAEQSKNIAAFLRQAQGLQPGMTSFESMAAQLAAVASLSGMQPGLAQFYPANLGLWYGLQQPSVQKPSDSPQSDHHQPPNASSSPLSKELHGTTSGEQPLDLSAKSGTSGNPEPKTIFKAKPRLTTNVPNKRAYTEEELQNALRDILSGKLGTRRAAVIYGIPRSTLRNKVYKYTTENRQQIPRPEVVIPAILDDDDDDDAGDTGNDSDRPTETQTPIPAEEMMRLQAAALQNFMKEEQPQKPTPPVMPPLLDANLLIQLQTLLLGGGLGTLPGLMAAKPDEVAALPEVLRKFMLSQQEMMKQSVESNGQPYLNMLQQQQHFLNKQLGSKSEEEHSESGGDDLVPIRIPSFKPVPGGSKNNGDVRTTPPPPALRPVVPNHSLHPNHHLPETSPPLRARSDSQSPPQNHKAMMSLSDVIANSITQRFHADKHHAPSTLDSMEQYKRPSISVIKSFGSIERFGQSPSNMSANVSPGSNTGTGGKGTRPKRGKYRNYDRDSLVEAVKAVQRGEMSVHRAGSYYGVPHSTLEYKVKERHLMRPRKREPKPQPLDGTSSSSTGVPKSPAGSASLLDKTKLMQTTAKPPLKTPPFPSTSPNGMKVSPMFDTAMAQMQYPSPFMWPPHNFPMQVATDFASRAGSTATQQPPPFPPNAESIFAQHMLQRMQEERGNKNGQPKSTQELAESLYDTNSTNGSFLDGIIRHSLQDKKPGVMNHGALFDQLVKNNRLTDPDTAMMHATKKRAGSPLSFAQTDIKRERASPDGGTTSDDQKDDYPHEGVENLIKLREGLSLKLEPKQDQDLNNGSSAGTNDDTIRTTDDSS